MFVVYIHGFASSPQSSKAQFLARRFAERGVEFMCPDFNHPGFSTLTVSRILGQLEDRITSMPPGDVVLIGSSLGGFVAVEAAARQATKPRHPISHLVLLAPALELEWERWSELGTGGIEGWRQAGSIEVFHHGENKPQHLNFEFYEDAQRFHPGSKQIHLPLLIFQGRHDESVSPAIVETFACAQPDSTLHLLEDGHQLKNSLEFIWLETSRFLSLDR